VDAYPDSEYISYAGQHPDLFKSIHLSRITVNSSQRNAQQILNSIKDGTSTFEDAARSQSTDTYADRGGDMGIRYAYELIPEITVDADREKVTSFARGELSDVIRIGDSWAFFRVEDELKDPNLGDETVLEKVRSYMRNNERGLMENWAIDQASAFIADANSADFDTALGRLGKTKSSFGPVPINYGSVDLFEPIDTSSVPELSNSLSDENFWRTLFSTKLNTLSQPLVQGSNVLVFLPTEQAEPDESGIETIASIYSGYWLDYMTEQSLNAYFLNSAKLDNRFIETYVRYFMPLEE
jgi:hypothetical protein